MTANSCAIGDPKSLRAEAAELAAEYAPRRFALCWLDVEEDDGGILLWGLELASDRVIVMGEDGYALGVFSSAEAARTRFAHARDLVLIWLDEPARPGESSTP